MKKILPMIIVTLLVIVYIATHNQKQNTDILEVRGEVLSVDNTEVLSSGFSNIGYQFLEVKVKSSDFKGQKISAVNLLAGQNEYDELYKEKDHIILALKIKDHKIVDAKTISMDRRFWMMSLILVLAVALVLYARYIGLKALISFVISILVIWFVLIKGLLAGLNPLILTTLTVALLSAIIIFLVSGFNKRGLTAFLGTCSGLIVTLIFTSFWGSKLALFGMTQPYVQTLVVSGYFSLNLVEIFYAAIILGASGAAMDIAVDIAASMQEITLQNPLVTKKSLMKSGINIGRQVIGTMTTTLLLAYSGSYLTLLMVFMSKDTSFIRMMNMKIVAAEIMRTILGSIGLIIVAPMTAIIGGLLLTQNRFDNALDKSDENSSKRRNIVA